MPSLLYYFPLSPHRDRPDPYTDRKDGIGMAMEEKRLPGEPGGHRIEKLSLDGGDLLVEGTVDSLTYEEEEPPRGGLLGRLFRG